MSKNELLYEKYEKYEEALFDLLMDQVSEEEGKKLLEENERLQNDPAAAIPEEVYQRGLKTIRREFAQRKWRPRGKMMVKVFRRSVAAVCIIIVVISTVVFAAFPELREQVRNTLMDVHDTYTAISFEPDDLTSETYELNVGWMPGEFILEEKGSSARDTWADYRSESGAYIILSKSNPYYQSVDSENSNIGSVSIQDFEGTLITNENQICVFWINIDANIAYKVFAENVPTDIVIKIAQNFL